MPWRGNLSQPRVARFERTLGDEGRLIVADPSGVTYLVGVPASQEPSSPGPTRNLGDPFRGQANLSRVRSKRAALG
mgnify:CR=1 FL=1